MNHTKTYASLAGGNGLAVVATLLNIFRPQDSVAIGVVLVIACILLAAATIGAVKILLD